MGYEYRVYGCSDCTVRAIVLPIITFKVDVESTIHLDNWKAYSNLSDHGYMHETVNHQLHFIDLETGGNIQS